jgi:hypothetical protein
MEHFLLVFENPNSNNQRNLGSLPRRRQRTSIKRWGGRMEQKKSVKSQMAEWNARQRVKGEDRFPWKEEPRAVLGVSGIFKAITSLQQANAVVKNASTAFFVLAGLQGTVGLIVNRGLIVDAVVLAVVALLLRLLRSRIAACILLLLTSVMLGTTVMTLLQIAQLGGGNILLAVAAFLIACKSVEATFKIHGRFKTPEQDDGQLTSESALSDEVSL